MLEDQQQSLIKSDQYYKLEDLMQTKKRDYHENLESLAGKPYNSPDYSENFFKTRFVCLANYNLKPHMSKLQVKRQNNMNIVKIPDEKKAQYQHKQEIYKNDKSSVDQLEKWESDILNYYVKPKQGLIEF